LTVRKLGGRMAATCYRCQKPVVMYAGSYLDERSGVGECPYRTVHAIGREFK